MSGTPGSTLDNRFARQIVVKRSRLKRPLSSPEFFQSVLSSSGLTFNQKAKRGLSSIQKILLSAAAIALLMGGYYSYVGFKSVKNSNLQAASLSALANKASSSGSGSSSGLSTAKISASTLASYTVAPNLPRYLMIPKLNVDARVLSVGVLSDGSIGTPQDIYDTAWYNESAQPGQPGAMLIDGHISSWTAHGVFYGLTSLVVGDVVQVQRGDGTIFTYKVVRSQIYPASKVDMQSALKPVVTGQPGLNLISCTGDVIPGTSSFNERIVVYTTQVSS